MVALTVLEVAYQHYQFGDGYLSQQYYWAMCKINETKNLSIIFARQYIPVK